MSEIKELFQAGRRYLICDPYAWTISKEHAPVTEVECLEISPKGRLKLKYMAGNVSWVKPETVKICELLALDDPKFPVVKKELK